MGQYFFLSYARGDDDPWKKKFFDLLSAEVRAHAGLGRHERVGFFDTSTIEPGTEWPDELATALSQAHTFIALMAPRYFKSVNCGQEWSVFDGRLDQHRTAQGSRPPSLIPVMWMAGTEVHPVAARLQYPQIGLDQNDRPIGLRDLMRQGRYRDRKYQFIAELARTIVSLHDDHPLPPPVEKPVLRLVPNAFAVAVAPTPRESVEVRQAVKHVHFVVSAGNREEMSPVRSELGAYGNHDHSWAPYHPDPRTSVSDLASGLAMQRDFGAEVASTDGITDRLESAVRNNQIVVLLLDAWSSQLQDQRLALQRYDENSGPTTAVLAPWNPAIAENQSHWAQLDLECRRLLPRNVTRPDQEMFRLGIPSPESFGQCLEEVLEEAWSRVITRGHIYRIPQGEIRFDRPFLENP
ncbi:MULTISPECIES: TIR-like protein FxsC [Polymorphospora]|uniref:TIR-like protein FxsC n=1 Tax=Polymorphospora lycopeni TaxID=3140240 RepID=A0ABV5CLP6_9ACTN